LGATRLGDGSEDYLHMPAVKEALGALIPEDLHSSLDDPKKRLKKRKVASDRVCVNLKIHDWGVMSSK
jgi:hypothetical protein